MSRTKVAATLTPAEAQAEAAKLVAEHAAKPKRQRKPAAPVVAEAPKPEAPAEAPKPAPKPAPVRLTLPADGSSFEFAYAATGRYAGKHSTADLMLLIDAHNKAYE